MSIFKLDREQVEDIVGLSSMQEGILFHYLSNDETELYFSQLSLNITGAIDREHFENAWNFVIENNEMLRTVFRWENIKKPAQIILKSQPFCFREYDLTHIPIKEQSEKLEQCRKDERKEKFDLATGPLFRVSLYKLADDHYEMLLNNHHILYDGWSMGVLLKEFFVAYDRLAKNMSLDRLKKKPFKEYLSWLQKADKDKERHYWGNYLKNYNSQTLLSIDRVKHDGLTGVDNLLHQLPEGLSEKIYKLARDLKVTVSSILNVAWGILLQKYNDTQEVIFGTTVAGRNPEIIGVEEMVGLFINTVPQIFRCQQDGKINEIIQRMNQESNERRDFEKTSLVEIKSYSEMDSKNNLFDSIVVIENFAFFDELKNSDNPLQINSYTSFEMPNFDLTLEIVLMANIEINFIFTKEVFNIETIEELHIHFVNILSYIVDNSDQDIRKVEMLSDHQRKTLLFDFNNTEQAHEKNKTIHQIFEEQVEKSPELVAVEYEEKQLTYRELNKKANQLARILQKYGVHSETIVGLLMERSLDLVISLMAILKAGGAYLPIDPDYPTERIKYMLENSGARLILTNNKTERKLSFTTLQNFEANNQFEICLTKPRSHIKEFNELPMPDRSLINLNNYKDKIGMASVNNSITLQTTRGCPYKCLYCHKIWSKHHVHRTAENIFNEIKYYYDQGVRNFAVIDDCFNLDIANSSRLFRMIIANKLKLQLFFPNGLRGDILTPDYIDLMVEAGTRGINLSLETASPRLQKLLMKNLDLDKFKNVIDYIATKHPEIILELATMHGFPTETEDEAMMTLNFIKDVKWLHFPYIHILKVFPNTEMEEFALANGISKADILISKDRAFHELPETLPFPKSFTRQYQSNFLNEYFLNKERLKQVIPVQMKILDESALAQKYNAYLPVEIKNIADVLKFAEIDDFKLPIGTDKKQERPSTIFDREWAPKTKKPDAMRILLLDLSQHFSSHSMLYKVVEQPIGLIYLQTYLNQQFGDQVDGRVYKAGNDFDSYEELKQIIDEYQPDLIGIRTLTFFKEFFHETVSYMRQWGVKAPIITGGPYASSDYDTILLDRNADLVIRGEGEYTFEELIGHMLKNNLQLPSAEILRNIEGIAFVEPVSLGQNYSRQVLNVEHLASVIDKEEDTNLNLPAIAEQLAYVMYTSGTTGQPKGIMVEHHNVNNCIYWMQDEFGLNKGDVVVQRTNLSFDPSVWEIFWPLYQGGKVKLLTTEQGKDAQYLVELLMQNAKDNQLTMMYCPASLVTGMTYILNSRETKQTLKLPYFFIGAEPIGMDTVKSFYKFFDGQMVNTYGPTECTINNTYYYLTNEDERNVVPIGKPVANNQIYILSKNLQLIPIKRSGEIYIAGDSVARGYINNLDKCKEAFIDNPFGAGKLYKTGDIGRWSEDGNIEIMGRVDNQIKIRGYRIEPGEIENSLLKHPSILNCAVMVRDSEMEKDVFQVCKSCGITTSYPDITINEDGICNICEDQEVYLQNTENYFKNLDELKTTILKLNDGNQSGYDCLLLYSGGRGAGYALYQLVDMGLRVLAVTYDNGYFTRSDLENIKMVTDKLGVEHLVLTHPNSDEILKESLHSASTVCKGCFFTSSSLAIECAHQNKIKVVIGATLSRGQIIENKLFKFYKTGVTDVAEIERELLNLQKQTYSIEENIYNYIDIDLMKESEIYDQIKTLDFYRYCDVTNEEMIRYLSTRDPYWQSRKNYAIYSTNCPIKQVGDYGYLKKQNHHYYGSATSWEKRLGHINLDNLREDLKCNLTQKGYENFLRKIGYENDELNNDIETKYIAAYYEGKEELVLSELKEYLLQSIPEYMIPSYFTWMEKLPLDSNGKIDRKILPKPTIDIAANAQYVAPRNEIEKQLVEIWQKVLGVERVGIKDSFFALGGNSLSIIKLNEGMNKVMENETKLMDLFKYHTIEMFIEFYEEKHGMTVTQMNPEEEMEAILERFKRGEITMEEADRLIETLGE